ncbi:MAG: AEC family transporter [Ruminococcaceae bacterium]|nr:AEC family transporter [Oscillospiraceae bacterium]
MEIALITARQCIIMLAMMAIGFVAFRIKMLDKTSSSHISNFLMSVVVPCLIVNSLQQDYDKETLKGYFLALILAIAAHILAIIVAYVVIRNKKNESSINIARFAVIYSNAGFIAFPVVEAIFGTEGLFFASAYVAVYNFLSWTQGVALFSGGWKKVSLKKAFINPGVIGVTVGFILFFAQIKIPGIASDVVKYIASLNTPLAMIATGTFLAQVSFKETISDKRTYLVALLRLICIPVIMIGICKLTGLYNLFDNAKFIIGTVMVATACPTAVATSLLPAKYGFDGRYGSRIVVATTLMSMVTLPIIMFLYDL